MPRRAQRSQTAPPRAQSADTDRPHGLRQRPRKTTHFDERGNGKSVTEGHIIDSSDEQSIIRETPSPDSEYEDANEGDMRRSGQSKGKEPEVTKKRRQCDLSNEDIDRLLAESQLVQGSLDKRNTAKCIDDQQRKRRRVPEQSPPFSAADQLAALQAEKIRVEIEMLKAKTAAEIEVLKGKANAAEAASSGNQAIDAQPSKLSEEILSVASLFPVIDKVEVGRIFDGSFNPYNLYKLRLNQTGNRAERKTLLSFEEGEGLVYEKAVGKVRDYGHNYTIWSECFLNYIAILMAFFGTKYPTLHRALNNFHGSIVFLASVYDWTTAVLPLALDHHTELSYGAWTDPTRWSIPQDMQYKYCTVLRTKKPESSGHKSGSRSSYSGSGYGSSYDRKIPKMPNEWDKGLCWKYSIGQCHHPSCFFKHVCPKCGGKHPLKEHKDKDNGQ